MRAGLTASSLSQIENNQISPSLNSLENIAAALQVPMFYYLDQIQPNTIVRTYERRKLYFSDFRIGYELLSPDLAR